MRIAITGASGNVGTSLLGALARESEVDEIVGLVRRPPDSRWAKTSWVAADVARDPLEDHFRGCDVVVHLAWLIQPSRDRDALYAANVEGSRRVFAAAAAAGVRKIVYASSVGAYSPGPKDRLVDESWPTQGMNTSFYSRHKAVVERMLDDLEQERHDISVVRLRPALIFKRDAASGVRRLFAGPLLPNFLVRKATIPVIPWVEGLRFQAVHSYDVAEAYRLAIVSDCRGPFNVAADPVLDTPRLARLLSARMVSLPRDVLRKATAASWRLRLQPTPPGWVDMALQAPLMDASRVGSELGWKPLRSSEDALMDLLGGLRDAAEEDTPPLRRQTGGVFRWREFVTGIGGR